MTTRALLLVAMLGGLLIQTANARACDVPMPPINDLDLARFYADDSGSIVDPDRHAAHKAATAPIRDWLAIVTREADASLRQSTPSLGAYRARCALEWIERWAAAGAMTGTMATKQAEAERRWTLSGTALAYLKIKGSASPAQRDVIEGWLKTLAQRARTAFAAGRSKQNNHAYWLGLGLAATSLAADEPALWTEARAIYDTATAGITADGTLPLELARKSRALHYHAFAAMPLVTFAFLDTVRAGSDGRAPHLEALTRLVRNTAAGLADPALFDELATVAQDRPVKSGSGWLPLYNALPQASADVPSVEMPSGHRWLGGNVLLLKKVLSEPAAPPSPVP